MHEIAYPDNSFLSKPERVIPNASQQVEDDKLGQYLQHVGDTYPVRKVKPVQVPQWPEGTI